jgi:hypothetical protein
MKRLCYALLLCAIGAIAQDAVPEPTQAPDASYRLFRTRNTFNLLKLDTRSGEIWQVQWSTEPAERYAQPINAVVLAWGNTKAGRFTLYPTPNIFTFLLLDQVDGRQWSVQWGFKPTERLIFPICDLGYGAAGLQCVEIAPR